MADRELVAILLRGYESKELDYKAPLEWDEDDKKVCCGIVKDILGMANTKGGFIVVGVSEIAGGFSWDGLSEDQAATFDTTRLNRFLQNYSDPPINALLRKVPHDGKTFVVIEISQFPDTPHICQKEFPGVLTAPTLYVRTDNNETAPVRSSSDFRTVLEQATRNRGDALLKSFRSILVNGPQLEPTTKSSSADKFLAQRHDAKMRFFALNPFKEQGYKGYRESSFYPTLFEQNRFKLDQLRDAAERAHIDFAGWPFLFISRNRPEVTYAIQDGIETLIPSRDFAGNDRLDFWRIQQSGFFIQRVLMWEDSRTGREHPAPMVADFGAIAVYVAEAINCLARLYDGLVPDDENFNLVIRLLGTQNRELTSLDHRRPLWGNFVCHIPQIVVGRTRSLADWRAAVVDHAVDI